MKEIIDALDMLEKDKHISKEVMMEAIEKAVASACEQDFGKNTDIRAVMDRETGEIRVYTQKVVVEEIVDPKTDITLEDARMINPDAQIDDDIPVEITTMDFGRKAAQNARGIILQKIKEGEKKAVYDYFKAREKEIITGIVQRRIDNARNPKAKSTDARYSYSVNLDDKADTVVSGNELIGDEKFRHGDRIKLLIVEVKESQKGFRIYTSRTHPDFVKKLFEREVAEIAEGVVEIKSVAREAGSRTKIAVWSNDENVDAVGSCVGLNGNRVNSVVDELRNEKIDIVEWDEDPAVFIENALRPAKVISVDVDPYEKSAIVVVPDYQLSLAIGKLGQNARLAAKLTGYKIDIKNETLNDQIEAAMADYARKVESGEIVEEELYDDENAVTEDTAGDTIDVDDASGDADVTSEDEAAEVEDEAAEPTEDMTADEDTEVTSSDDDVSDDDTSTDDEE